MKLVLGRISEETTTMLSQKSVPAQIALGRISEIAAAVRVNWGAYLRRLRRLSSEMRPDANFPGTRNDLVATMLERVGAMSEPCGNVRVVTMWERCESVTEQCGNVSGPCGNV